LTFLIWEQETFPRGDKAHQQTRKELHDQLSAFFLQGLEPQAKSNKMAEDPTLALISNQLSPLFQAIAIVKHWQCQEADGTLPNDIKKHLIWNFLLTSYCQNLDSEPTFDLVACVFFSLIIPESFIFLFLQGGKKDALCTNQSAHRAIHFSCGSLL
jgi:hypothetical protein